ncbi:vesicle-mediated transport-related protein [Dioszegia hungarica]|uniref:AP complex subunit beta n=1 Tax=Dioszegia hungarica TaxID=4972 RepID=A0AA38HAR6_9TREE|nr:vesicle-mediated transport-related protein [Dioszegia hungarica]KAI9637892.1 vesicle-mediated transport-related protein [Dioszegia hungarica]
MADAKLFTRGKVQELRDELRASGDRRDKGFVRKKTALKKVVANMTMGNDMSALFPEITQCLAIQVLEIKKMVYLYLVNYGRSRPEEVTGAISGFLTDCHDRNPLIRGLAIRTMSSIPLPPIIQALIDPLRSGLEDQDPYVRKTSALAVAKLYASDFGKRIIDKEGFVAMLRDLLADQNPTVVANAVASLVEISDRSTDISLRLNATVAGKLVAALGECSEWGQVYILDSLLSFVPTSHMDAETLAERISVRLQHANSAVVLTTIKVIMYLMNYMEDEVLIRALERKMGPPLVTLLSSGSEVQYVGLRNILLIVQRRPAILQNEVKVFFCKYNDPIYVKLAKLEIMYRLTREDNVAEVLAELKEYASEVDVDFVRKAVRSIGRLAIKIAPAADRCIQTLLGLMGTKITYVVQEAIVVIKDIFRRYPNQYESIIGILCENLDVLDEPEAKSAMIWIIGQYADRIENSDELLEDFCFTFKEEAAEVQLALLTATVKLFIRRPTAAQELLPKVLKLATEEAENPDLRDRGFMYWRLLTSNPAAAREIVLSERPVISTETDRMDKGMLDQLLLHTGTLGSIYHKNPNTFIRTARARYLPDSPALNASSKRHLITPSGPAPALARLTISTSSANSGALSTPTIPSRSANMASSPMPAASPLPDASPVNGMRGGGGGGVDDVYGDLADLDFGAAGGGGRGGYETDAPRPRGGAEDLLF